MSKLKPRVAPDGRVLLNLGCGSRLHPDWTNLDLVATAPEVIVCDLLSGIPFDDNLFDMVYHSHFLEHLDRPSGRLLVKECYRVLKKGGLIRVVVPDLEYNANLYLQCLRELDHQDTAVARERYEWALLNLIDQMVRVDLGGEMRSFLAKPALLDLSFVVASTGGLGAKEMRDISLGVGQVPVVLSPRAPLSLTRIFTALTRRFRRAGVRMVFGKNLERTYQFRNSGEAHKWAYDKFSLAELLGHAGFSHVEFCRADESTLSGWASFHFDTGPDGAVRKPNSLFAEAVKP